MKNFVSYLSIALSVSMFWVFALINQKNICIEKSETISTNLKEIQVLKEDIFSLESDKCQLLYDLEEVKETTFKLQLLYELEKQRKVKTSLAVIDAIIKASEDTGYDLPFLLAWIDTETSFHPNPKPWRNVKGILQINYYIWKTELDLEKRLMSDPYYNILKGIDVLEIYKEMSSGDLHKALFLFNNGPSGKYGNTKYVPKIMKRMKIYDDIVKDIKSI